MGAWRKPWELTLNIGHEGGYRRSDLAETFVSPLSGPFTRAYLFFFGLSVRVLLRACAFCPLFITSRIRADSTPRVQRELQHAQSKSRQRQLQRQPQQQP